MDLPGVYDDKIDEAKSDYLMVENYYFLPQIYR